MSFVQKAGMAACAFLFMLATGCNDVFRPVAIPITTPSGDPQVSRSAFVINNAGGQQATIDKVNETGDTITGIFNAGYGPVFAGMSPSHGVVYVANTGCSFSATSCPSGNASVSAVSSGAAGGTVTQTVGLPTGARPVFLGSSDIVSMYVAEAGINSVAVISTTTLSITNTVPVGSTPVALAETTDGKKVYVANQGSNNVSVISTADFTVLNTIAVGAAPSWIVMKPDGSRVLVVNRDSGTISEIDTATDSVVATLTVGTSPTIATWDANLQRLYVVNSGSADITVFRTDVDPPAVLGTVQAGTNPTSLTPLADGSRVYVANSGSNDVTVINARNLTVSKTIPVGISPVSITSTPESTRVVVVNRDSNTISDIQTSNDTVVATVPTSSPNPVFVVIP